MTKFFKISLISSKTKLRSFRKNLLRQIRKTKRLRQSLRRGQKQRKRSMNKLLKMKQSSLRSRLMILKILSLHLFFATNANLSFRKYMLSIILIMTSMRMSMLLTIIIKIKQRPMLFILIQYFSMLKSLHKPPHCLPKIPNLYLIQTSLVSMLFLKNTKIQSIKRNKRRITA